MDHLDIVDIEINESKDTEGLLDTSSADGAENENSYEYYTRTTRYKYSIFNACTAALLVLMLVLTNLYWYLAHGASANLSVKRNEIEYFNYCKYSNLGSFSNSTDISKMESQKELLWLLTTIGLGS